MNNKGLTVTVVGWVASNPLEIKGSGVPFTKFRLGTTPRYFDNRQEAWADGRTEWITVKAFRDVAFNVAASVRKGDPVLVLGRLHTEEWVGEDGPRTSLVLEASALGHDLTYGTAKFARTVHVGASTGRPSTAPHPAGDPEEPGVPDVEDPWATDSAPEPADLDPRAGDADGTAAA